MAGKLYTLAILSLWVGSMAWLVSERILPAILSGEPPSKTMLNQVEPVAWRLSVDGKPCGVAVLQATRDVNGVSEIHSRVTLDRLEPPRAAPPWLAAIGATLKSLGLDIDTHTVFDPLERLSHFKMRITIKDLHEPVIVTGRVKDAKLELRVRAGEFADNRVTHDWPTEGLLASELMPEAKLLSAYVGRRWQKEVYSPFGTLKSPVEVLNALVVEEIKPSHNGQSIVARLVEFRAPVKAGVSDEGRLRATMLVAEDGRVLQHEAHFLGSRITFDRLSEAESARLGSERLDQDQNGFTESTTLPWEANATDKVNTRRKVGAAL
ncbi:hypothetical protein [Botrimarina hoheduenensis]|nr:hypothetical protein [Botrimarina hoheduenensis]